MQEKLVSKYVKLQDTTLSVEFIRLILYEAQAFEASRLKI